MFSRFSATEKMQEEGMLKKPSDPKALFNELFTDNEDYQNLIKGYETASKEDKAAIKKIGEDYYGKKGGEAPA